MIPILIFALDSILFLLAFHLSFLFCFQANLSLDPGFSLVQSLGFGFLPSFRKQGFPDEPLRSRYH
jgi:hypothetical protein